jgi:predicted RND superfamily exporter protein
VVAGRPAFARRNAVLLAAGALVLLAVLGASRLRLHHNAVNWFPRDNPARLALSVYEQTVGGAANILIMVNARPGETVKDRELLLALEELERRILAYRDERRPGGVVHNVISVLDPIRESWRALNGGEQGFYRLPDSQRGVSDMFTLFETAGSSELKRLATIDMSRALMVVRVRWMDALSYRPLKEYIEEAIEEIVGSRARARATGSIYLDILILSRLLFDLLRSFGAALAVITVIMMVLLRDLRLGLLAMLPNLLPILCTMGFMGYASIHLDLSTILLGSLAIGIVVDDTIHLLHQFNAHYRLHRDVEQAIAHAMRHTGRAMVITSLILAIGFFCNVFAVLQNFRLSGILLGLTICFAIFFDLVFAPALLRAVYRSERMEHGPKSR